MASDLEKNKLLRWCFWYFAGNVILFYIISLKYFPAISWFYSDILSPKNKILLKIYATLLQIGFFGIWGLMSAGILMIAVHLCLKRNVIFLFGIVFVVITAILLVIDVYAYRLAHFHLNGVIFHLLINSLADEVFGLSQQEYIFASGVIIGLIIFEIIYAAIVWQYIINKKWLIGCGKWFVITVALSFYISYSILVYSNGYVLHRVIVDVGRGLPFYSDLFGVLLFGKNGAYKMDHVAQEHFIQVNRINLPLNYPLEPLHFTPVKKPNNILVIVIDAWRFDMISENVTPNLFSFAKKSWVFKQHFSGGNATGPGIFSLFYGLPVPYWPAMESQHRGPVLIDALQKQGYQIGIFASARLDLPAFDKTVFATINNLQINTPGVNPYEKDRSVTRAFKQFVLQSNKPFFSFLFYDAVHGFCSFDDDLHPFEPVAANCDRSKLTNLSDPSPYFNRYKNALLLVDEQVGQVLNFLKDKNILDDTLVLITSDHGEEFNDNASGYWGHTSNFSRYQIQVPLIVHWPGKTAKEFIHLTSHYDVVPTLMKYSLGCDTKPSVYSLGKELLDTNARSYLIIGSYVDFTIAEPDRITRILPSGNYFIQKVTGESLPDDKLNMHMIRQVCQDLKQFYQISKPSTR